MDAQRFPDDDGLERWMDAADADHATPAPAQDAPDPDWQPC
ncbi:MAG: hypothetical protein ABFC67_10655 [Mizugakiibacter sp.]